MSNSPTMQESEPELLPTMWVVATVIVTIVIIILIVYFKKRKSQA